jgi:hypothetical protein
MHRTFLYVLSNLQKTWDSLETTEYLGIAIVLLATGWFLSLTRISR